LVCLLESFGNVRWRVGESLGTLFCKPSLLAFSVCPQGRQSFSLYGFGSGQIVSVLVMIRRWHIFVMALVFMFHVVLPESR